MQGQPRTPGLYGRLKHLFPLAVGEPSTENIRFVAADIEKDCFGVPAYGVYITVVPQSSRGSDGGRAYLLLVADVVVLANLVVEAVCISTLIPHLVE